MQTYKTRGTCSRQITFDVTDDGKVKDVKFLGGCLGNLQALGKLVEGMDIDEVIAKLQGIRCGAKSTSCPDQLSQCLLQYKNSMEIKS